MSPTEFELRAALRDGEGDGISADRVVIAAQRRRAQRRTRLLTTAASVVVAAAVAGGVTAIARSGSSESAGPRNGPAKAANGSVPEPTAAVGRAGDFGNAPHVPCPATLPHYALPGGGSPGQFGSGGPLFTKPVSWVLVCDYATFTPRRVATLGGSSASAVVSSLESASKQPTGHYCPSIRSTTPLAIVGVGANGEQIGVVKAELTEPTACDVAVTNGTAVRYDWTPPADVTSAITAALAGRASQPPGIMHGSPIAS